ncbi:hypothetical protein K491DRAFT_759560 [Lophiostoma macrostomum CBS 122681]|uniref:Uncharacterized protein n=1 Tax=Lophiostoma macrostomum CBS 122681 TaxID=1314788 RepID=A0A6A6T485_9PLEO|nr:hypothetical protein K491DRAFT_759560 [Lophiostoma macrostomum CBS 122681]
MGRVTPNALAGNSGEQATALGPINRLPNEILLDIFKEFAEVNGGFPLEHVDFNPKVYHSLTLVSRTFNRNATPLLYAAILPRYESLHTFMAQPKYLHHVRKVDLLFWINYKSLSFSALDKLDLYPLASRYNLPWSHQILTDASGFDRDAFALALLLCQTPHIQELYIDRTDQSTYAAYLPAILDPLLSAMRPMKDSPDTVHTFAHLHTLRVNMKDVWIGRASCLFKLESLKHLTMFNLSAKPKQDGDLDWECPPGVSSVQDLRLNCRAIGGPKISAAIIASAINSCRALRTFSVKCMDEMLREEWVDIVIALLQQKHTLESLELNDVFDHFVGEPFHVFRELTKLRHFLAPMRFLLGVGGQNNIEHELPDFRDILPASLEQLSVEMEAIHDDNPRPRPQEDTTQAFMDLLDGIATRFPKLKEVWVDYKFYEINYELEMPLHFASLEKRYQEAGLDFGFALQYGAINSSYDREEVKDYIKGIKDGDYAAHAEEPYGPPLFSLAELGHPELDHERPTTVTRNAGNDLDIDEKPSGTVGSDDSEMSDRASVSDDDSGSTVSVPCLGCEHLQTSKSAVRTRLRLPDKRMRAQRKCYTCDFL